VIVQYESYFSYHNNDNDIDDVFISVSVLGRDGDHVTLYTVNAHTLTGDNGADADDPPPDLVAFSDRNSEKISDS
jgi:hypothetical protein